MAEKEKAAGVVIAGCDCKSEYQDAKYGPGKRVHNLSAKAKVCTVCGKSKNL